MGFGKRVDERLTVGQLTQFAELHCRIIAGHAGGARTITWAHSSELVDPTPWLDGGELLMTTGMAIPSTPDAQVAYLQRLADNDIAGLAIGDRSQLGDIELNKVSPEFFEAADRLSLPIVTVSGRTPFIAIARYVAAANQDTAHARMARHLRVYWTLGEIARSGATIDDCVRRLSEVSGYELSVVTANGRPMYDGCPRPACPIEIPQIAEALATEDFASRVPQPLADSSRAGRHVYAVPVLSRRRAVGVLVAVAYADADDDRLILHHIATIVSLLVADLYRQRERARREGGEILSRALLAAERGKSVSIGEMLSDRSRESLVFAVVELGGAERGWQDLHHRLAEHGFVHRLTRRLDRAAIVIAVGEAEIEALGELLLATLPDATIGLSRALPPTTELLVARREARWALRSAVYNQRRIQHHSSADQPSLLMLDASGLEHIVDGVLGPLVAHDAETSSDLEQTLRVFLECNRSWKTASERLFIHRQTLIHRIKRIESLIGRRLDSTDDVCDIWMALKAQRALAVVGAGDD